MPRIFAITTPHDSLKIRPGSDQKEVSFTITNNSDRPLRAQVKLRPQDQTQADWLTVTSESTCELTAGGTQQATVGVKIPAGTEPGKYTFRIDAISIANPDEDYSEGPSVKLEVQPAAAPKKPFPWWILAVVAVVLGVGGVLWWVLLRKVEVPAVEGEPIENARVLVSEAKLTYRETQQTSREETPGLVIDQAPPAGEKVKPKSEVALTVAVAPTTTAVPPVTGMSLSQAARTLQENGLSVGNIRGNRLQETVISTNPAVGEEVALGTPIDITMPGRFIVVDPIFVEPFLPRIRPGFENLITPSP